MPLSLAPAKSVALHAGMSGFEGAHSLKVAPRKTAPVRLSFDRLAQDRSSPVRSRPDALVSAIETPPQVETSPIPSPRSSVVHEEVMAFVRLAPVNRAPVKLAMTHSG